MSIIREIYLNAKVLKAEDGPLRVYSIPNDLLLIFVLLHKIIISHLFIFKQYFILVVECNTDFELFLLLLLL